NSGGLPEATRTTVTEVPALPTSNIPQESKTTVPRVVGCTIVGGVLGFTLLLLIIILIRYRRFRVALARKFHRHRQNFNITALPISTPHVVTPSSSLSERKLLRNAGRNQITQSLLPAAQNWKLPIPEPPLTLQLRDHTEDAERSREPPHLQADGTAGRNDLDEGVERAVQVLQSQFDVMAQRVAQLESDLAEHSPPDYTSSYRGPSHSN
ncbi:hypothetical protein PQX77_018304, partial [Marasmius sp. AFHP31]